MKPYKEYLEEIETFKERYDLTAIQVVTLQFLASVESNEISYDKFKKEIGII